MGAPTRHARARTSASGLVDGLDRRFHLGAAWSRLSRRHDERLRSALVLEETYRPYTNLPRVTDPAVAAHFDSWRDTVYRAWLYDLHGPAWIEPERGYVIDRSGLLANASFAYWDLGRPPITSLGRYAAARVERRAPHFDVAVSVRTHHEGNYYHFWDDFLGTLRAVEALGLDRDVPLLIGPRLHDAQFFRQALRRSRLGQLRWVPHHTVIRADRVIFGHRGSLLVENFRYARELMQVRRTPGDPQRRLFVTRARNRGRFLNNEHAMMAMLAPLGFERVDPDTLTLEQQIELFAGARAVVAVHGAGVTNIQFRDPRPLALVELFAADYVQPPFAWLSAALRFTYDAVMGSASDPQSGFAVDVDAVHTALAAALSSELDKR